MAVSQPTPEELVEAHQGRLYGFLRGRVSNDALAHDLAQATWLEVWKRIDTFDPNIGTFWAFTRVWANIVLTRHWSAKSDSREQPADDLRSEEDAQGGVDGLGATDGAAPLEDAVTLSQALHDLLCRMLSCSRPPHEIVVFGFCKLKWKPSEIVDEFAPIELLPLARRLEKDFAAIMGLPSLAKAFAALHDKMAVTLRESTSDPRTLRLYAALADRRTAETVLADYFALVDSAEVAVSRWSESVKRAVFADLRRSRGSVFFQRLKDANAPLEEVL